MVGDPPYPLVLKNTCHALTHFTPTPSPTLSPSPSLKSRPPGGATPLASPQPHATDAQHPHTGRQLRRLRQPEVRHGGHHRRRGRAPRELPRGVRRGGSTLPRWVVPGLAGLYRNTRNPMGGSLGLFCPFGDFFLEGFTIFFDTFDYCWLFLAPFGPFLSTSDYFWLPSPIFGYLDHLLLLWSILTIFWPFGGFWYIFGHFLTHFDDFWPLCASLWDVGFSKQMRMRWVRLLGEVGADRCQG